MGGNFVFSPVEFLIPVCGELVIGEPANFADNELTGTAGSSRNRWDEISTRRIAELTTLKIQQIVNHRIDAGDSEGPLNRAVGAVRGQDRERRANHRARR